MNEQTVCKRIIALAESMARFAAERGMTRDREEHPMFGIAVNEDRRAVHYQKALSELTGILDDLCEAGEWSAEFPKVAGYYWRRAGGSRRPTIVKVIGEKNPGFYYEFESGGATEHIEGRSPRCTWKGPLATYIDPPCVES